MEAIIEVETLRQDWKPPFEKKRDIQSFAVKEGMEFEQLKNGRNLFRVEQVLTNKILLGYDSVYALKGYEQSAQRKVWLTPHAGQNFSSLWEDNGVTKRVTLREVKPITTE
jgi:hypothetical protein